MGNERVFRDRNNPLDYMDDAELKSRYRFGRGVIIMLCDLLNPALQRLTDAGRGLAVSLQILIALRFYATGNFFQMHGDYHGVHKSTISRVVHAVTEALCNKVGRFIRFPTSAQEKASTITKFAAVCGFPRVIGAVDGTQIPITQPATEDEKVYVCRKGYHAINVMIVCDSNLRITCLYAKFPGSSHDSFVFRNSNLHDAFERGEFRDCWLLGDSGYPCRPYILTPWENADSPAKERYNFKHAQTRNTVERTIGLLKARFRCLDLTGGHLMFAPAKVCRFVVACGILHNIAVDRNVEFDEDYGTQRRDHGEQPRYVGPLNTGDATRMAVTNLLN